MSRQHAEVVSRKFHCDQNHTFFTMFPSSYHHEMFRSYYHGQKWCPCKRSRSKAKVTEVNTPHSHFWTVTPVWIRILQWNHAHSLNQHRRGVFQGHLSNFKVTGGKKSPISTRIWCFRTVTPAWNDPWPKVTWDKKWPILTRIWRNSSLNWPMAMNWWTKLEVA